MVTLLAKRRAELLDRDMCGFEQGQGTNGAFICGGILADILDI